MQHLENLRNIFIKSLQSVFPQNLITPDRGYNLKPVENHISIQKNKINITKKRCHIVGFGKAVLGMAVALERNLGKHLVNGILSIPKGTIQTFRKNCAMQLSSQTVLRIYEGAEHNQPDDISVQAALRIRKMVQTLNKDDILFVLISGGGSALLTLPRYPLNVEKKSKVIKKLASKGASIEEINTIRITLSNIKGGKLALAASNAFAVISFILSDIIGDPVHLIASGPTYAINNSKNSKKILQKYDIWNSLTSDIKNIIAEDEEICNYSCSKLPNNYVYVVGNNNIACLAAQEHALAYNYLPFILSNTVQGDIEHIVDEYYTFIKLINSNKIASLTKKKFNEACKLDIRNWDVLLNHLHCYKTNKNPLLLILGGEPTVKVLGNGVGGRNQELALRLSKKLYDDPYMKNVYFLSAGTDGIDGPTPAAGALGCAAIIEQFLENYSIYKLECYIKNNDSYNFYKTLSNGKYQIITGHTGTNVMDLHFLLML